MSRAPEERNGGHDTPELPDYSPDGVDLTLIRYLLSLTPRERLLVAQQAANSLLELRAAKSNC